MTGDGLDARDRYAEALLEFDLEVRAVRAWVHAARTAQLDRAWPGQQSAAVREFLTKELPPPVRP
jgi:hypothetical protein